MDAFVPMKHIYLCVDTRFWLVW